MSLGPPWWPSAVCAILGPKAVTRVGRQQVIFPELGQLEVRWWRYENKEEKNIVVWSYWYKQLLYSNLAIFLQTVSEPFCNGNINGFFLKCNPISVPFYPVLGSYPILLLVQQPS